MYLVIISFLECHHLRQIQTTTGTQTATTDAKRTTKATIKPRRAPLLSPVAVSEGDGVVVVFGPA